MNEDDQKMLAEFILLLRAKWTNVEQSVKENIDVIEKLAAFVPTIDARNHQAVEASMPALHAVVIAHREFAAAVERLEAALNGPCTN
jgi:hypothetical protein